MNLSANELLPLVTRRTPLCHEDVPFIVLWAHKSGCTSILKRYLWHVGCLEEALAYKVHARDVSIHLYENEIFKAGPKYKQRLVRRIVDATPIVNFVRCPYERAFSGYMHLQNRSFVALEREGIVRPGFKVRKTILRAVYGFDTPVEYPFSFLDYLHWLQDQDMRSLDPHHTPQSTPLYDLPEVRHYRLEQITLIWPRLEEQYGLNRSNPSSSLWSSGHHTQKTELPEQVVLTLIDKGIPLTRSPKFEIPAVGRSQLLGTEAGELIEHLFFKDLALYDSLEQAE